MLSICEAQHGKGIDAAAKQQQAELSPKVGQLINVLALQRW